MQADLLQRIENKRECRPRLAAVLRAEGEHYYLTFAAVDLNYCGLAVQKFLTEHPAGQKSVLSGVAGDYADVQSARFIAF